MPKAVIVSTARSPIGRAHKGSLTKVRPDDLAATIVRAALDKVPELDPTTVEDVILGTAQPAGMQGYNIARIVGDLAGMGHTARARADAMTIVFVTHEPDIAQFCSRVVVVRDGRIVADHQQAPHAAADALAALPTEEPS